MKNNIDTQGHSIQDLSKLLLSTSELLLSANDKSGKTIFLRGEGGTGKTTLLKKMLQLNMQGTRFFPIFDLANPYYWGVENLISDACIHCGIENNLGIYPSLLELGNFLTKNHIIGVFLLDTVEQVGNEKASLILNTFNSIKNSITIFSGRKYSPIFNPGALLTSQENNMIFYDIDGISKIDAKKIIYKNLANISSDQEQNLFKLCSIGNSENKISPLYLSLFCEAIMSGRKDFLDDDLLSQIQIKSKKRSLIRLYINNSSILGELALILSIIRYPISSSLWNKLKDSFGLEHMNLSWEKLVNQYWIRSTADTSVTLHDELANQASLFGLQGVYFDNSAQVKEEVIKIVYNILSDMFRSGGLSAPDTLLFSTLKLILHPDAQIGTVLHEIENLAQKKSTFAETYIHNFLSLLSEDRNNFFFISAFGLGITDEFRHVFFDKPNHILKLSRIISSLVQSRALSYITLKDYVLEIEDKKLLNDKDLAELYKDLSFAAMFSRVLTKSTDLYLQKTLLLYKNTGNHQMVSRVTAVYGYFCRLTYKYSASRRMYLSALSFQFDKIEEPNFGNVIAIIIKNFSALEAYSSNLYDALFMVNRVECLVELSPYDSINNITDMALSLKGEIARLSQNFTEAKKLNDLARSTDTSDYQELLFTFRDIKIDYQSSNKNSTSTHYNDIFSRLELIEFSARQHSPNLLSHIIRLKGVLLLKKEINDPKQAETYFSESIRISQIIRDSESSLIGYVSLSCSYILDFINYDHERHLSLITDIRSVLAQLASSSSGLNTSQLKFQLAHWGILANLNSFKFDDFYESIRLYKHHALSIFGRVNSSPESQLAPNDIQIWSRVMAILNKFNQKAYIHVINELTRSFSYRNEHTISNETDKRAILITLLTPLRREAEVVFSPELEENHLQLLRANKLLEKAHTLYEMGHYGAARSNCIDCIVCCINVSSAASIRTEACFLISFLEIIEGNFHDALFLVEYATDEAKHLFSQNILDHEKYAKCFLFRADTLMHVQNYSESWKSYNEALTHCNIDNYLRASIYTGMSMCAYFAYLEHESLVEIDELTQLNGDSLFHKAEEYSNRGLILVDQHSTNSSANSLKSTALINKGIIHSISDARKSIKYIIQGSKLAWYLEDYNETLRGSILIMSNRIEQILEDKTKKIEEDSLYVAFENTSFDEIAFRFQQIKGSQIYDLDSFRSSLAQFNLTLSIFKLVAAPERSNLLEPFTMVVAKNISQVFDIPVTAPGRSNVPLGYNTWVKAIASLEKEETNYVVREVSQFLRESSNELSGSPWVFLSEVSLS